MTNTILSLAHSILVGVWGAESSHSRDPRTFEFGHHAVGPLQVTAILCLDYNVHHEEADWLMWPHDFIVAEAWSNSVKVYEWTMTHYGPRLRQRPEDVTARDLALLWRYGRKGCVDSHFSDPEGYWEMVQARSTPQE